MSKYIDAEHLKVEIEKHIKEVKDAAERFTPNMGFFDAKLSGIYYVMDIINSLQQEQPSEDLEEAAARYERENRQSVLSSVDIVNAFIEGARWKENQMMDEWLKDRDGCFWDGVNEGKKAMENQMPMPEDTVIFQKGVAEGRRLEREEVPRWKKGPADSAIRTRDYWPVSDAPVLGKPETRDYLIVKRGESMALAFHAEEGDYYLSTEELDKIPTE